MERHPAGCDPRIFLNQTSTIQQPRRSPNQDYWLRIPGIDAALTALETLAQHPLQYNCNNRFDAAARKLSDAFLEHLKTLPIPTKHRHRRRPSTTRLLEHSDSDSDSDSESLPRKRSIRLRKRRRPRYLSDDEQEHHFLSGRSRKTLPRRSKEIRPNLNDDLAYQLMVDRAAQPPPVVVESELSEESDVSEESTINPRMVRPLPYVRHRPLVSDHPCTPFIEADDDDTDTEVQRREHSRRSLKSVIYGSDKAVFTEKEIRAVFPTGSKRRLKQDALVLITKRSPMGPATIPPEPWHVQVNRLAPIPKDMIARYISGSYWLSPDPRVVVGTDVPVFPRVNGLLPTATVENVVMAKQRLPSLDRETRDGDSEKASPATYVQSGSSTQGSPHAKKPDMHNGDMDIELGPSLSSLDESQREEGKEGRSNRITHRKNGMIHQSPKPTCRAWKDLAPYGRIPKPPQLPPQPLQRKISDPPNNAGVAPVLQNVHRYNPPPVVQKKQPTPPNTAVHQKQVLHPMNANQPPYRRIQPTVANASVYHHPVLQTMKTIQSQQTQSQKRGKAPTRQVSQAMARTIQPADRLQSRKMASASSLPPFRTSQPLPKPTTSQQTRQIQEIPTTKSQQISSSPPSNQMTVVARGSPAMSNFGIPPAQSVQPQLSLQPQTTILTAFPVQFSPHQAGFPAHQALHLQQYGQDPRILSQWQLQNTAIPQAHGALQLSTGYVGMSSVVTPTPPGPIPVQSRIVPVQAGVPIASNALVPAGTTMRPDVVNLPANGMAVPAAEQAVEAAQPTVPSPSSVPPARQGNFNSQFQVQYQKHYDETYSKRYQEHMKTLKKEGADGDTS